MAKKNVRAIVEDYNARIAANPRSRNLGKFLSVWPEIKQLLDEGWSAKRIWAALNDAGVVKVKYSTFISHVKKYSEITASTTIKTPKEDDKKAGAANSAPAAQSAGFADKPKPAASWGKPIERNPNTTLGQIPKFGLDQSKEEYGIF